MTHVDLYLVHSYFIEKLRLTVVKIYLGFSKYVLVGFYEYFEYFLTYNNFIYLQC